jgi:hypothetical protein
VGQFFVESYGVRMRGGYWRFQAQYLRRIRVPSPKDVSQIQSNDLRKAFQERDRGRATRIALELYGIDAARMETALGATKKWDLMVVSEGQLVMAMEFKSQAGKSIGNNLNNRAEEAVGSAKDIWTAYREGRFGQFLAPFLGYFFLLEDRQSVRAPVSNKEPYFPVDPAFRREPRESSPDSRRYHGVSYSARYELLCRRLVLERLYSSACFLMATNSQKTQITQPADDLNFHRFAASLRGHAVTFLGDR